MLKTLLRDIRDSQIHHYETVLKDEQDIISHFGGERGLEADELVPLLGNVKEQALYFAEKKFSCQKKDLDEAFDLKLWIKPSIDQMFEEYSLLDCSDLSQLFEDSGLRESMTNSLREKYDEYEDMLRRLRSAHATPLTKLRVSYSTIVGLVSYLGNSAVMIDCGCQTFKQSENYDIEENSIGTMETLKPSRFHDTVLLQSVKKLYKSKILAIGGSRSSKFKNRRKQRTRKLQRRTKNKMKKK